MAVIPDSNGCFDQAAISAMGIAFDRACTSLQVYSPATAVREIIATRILEVAAEGERDPDRLHDQALKSLDIEQTPKPLAA
jgi:hypothetical protein